MMFLRKPKHNTPIKTSECLLDNHTCTNDAVQEKNPAITQKIIPNDEALFIANKIELVPAEDNNPDRDIVQEVASINQQIHGQPPAYKKTKYWHQQSSGIQDSGRVDQFGQITEHLTRIEEKLDGIEKILKS